MKPETLSATAAKVYESCPARYKAYLERVPEVSGHAANLGNVLHDTLEEWVKDGAYLTKSWGDLVETFDAKYYLHLNDTKHHSLGLEMLERWYNRTDWTDVEVLMVESKRRFPLKHNGSAIPFVYKFDRLDRNAAKEIEVIDYKTTTQPLTADSLEHDLQARAYGVAGQVLYPDEKRIWVTFDFLRYEPVGVAFTKDENRATAKYLRALYARILADDGSKETLNAECRWCIRRYDCRTLQRHIKGGGPLKMNDVNEAALQRYELHSAKAALETMIDDLDNYLLEHAEQEDTLNFTTDQVRVQVTARSRRHVNPQSVADIVGPAKAVGVNTVDALERLQADPSLSDDQRSRLKKAVDVKFSEPSIKTSKRPGV